MLWVQIATTAVALAAIGTLIYFMLASRRRKGTTNDPTSCETAHRELETRMKALEMEWEDTYDRIKKAYRKMGGEARWAGQATSPDTPDVAGELVAPSKTPHALRRAILTRSRHAS